jgi:hypothetical protein
MKVTPYIMNFTSTKTNTKNDVNISKPIKNDSVSFDGNKCKYTLLFDASLKSWLFKNPKARNEWNEVTGKNKDLIIELKKNIKEAANRNYFINNVTIFKLPGTQIQLYISGEVNHNFGFTNIIIEENNYVKALEKVQKSVEEFYFLA